MYRVQPDWAWWPAVGARLERGVRPHWAATTRAHTKHQLPARSKFDLKNRALGRKLHYELAVMPAPAMTLTNAIHKFISASSGWFADLLEDELLLLLREKSAIPQSDRETTEYAARIIARFDVRLQFPPSILGESYRLRIE
jgi:hypothetical protein